MSFILPQQNLFSYYPFEDKNPLAAKNFADFET